MALFLLQFSRYFEYKTINALSFVNNSPLKCMRSEKMAEFKMPPTSDHRSQVGI